MKSDPDYEAAKEALSRLWRRLGQERHQPFASLVQSVEAQYHGSLHRITAEDIGYVMTERGDRTARWFARSVPPWAKPLARPVRVLLQMLRDIMAAEFRAPWRTMAAITSMMLYIGDPIDILPNVLPGIGHIDDALVVALCLSTVKKDLARYTRQKGVAQVTLRFDVDVG